MTTNVLMYVLVTVIYIFVVIPLVPIWAMIIGIGMLFRLCDFQDAAIFFAAWFKLDWLGNRRQR